jgi:nucleotide-binding universal stress UspA family protein
MDGDHLHGLHIVNSEAQKNSISTQAIRDEFMARCEAANISGDLKVEVGKVADIVVEFASYTDLLVVDVTRAPGTNPLAKLASGLHTIILNSCRPVLLVPKAVPSFSRMLLAFDGSPKSREALYVAAYLAGKWKWHLDVLTIPEAGKNSTAQQDALAYLEAREIPANYISKEGDAGEVILETAREQNTNEIILGGYGRKPVMQLMLGSAVDKVVKQAEVPVLICR